LHQLALFDARHRPIAARTATGERARLNSRREDERGERETSKELLVAGRLPARARSGEDVSVWMMIIYTSNTVTSLFTHSLLHTTLVVQTIHVHPSMQSLCSPLSPSRASHRPPPQPFLLTPKRIGPPPACLSSPYSSLQTLQSTPATRDLLPLHASHARRPMTGRKNPLV